MSSSDLIQKIDRILPQTQCGLCGYAGCKPYAAAIVERNEEINRCPPGGPMTLQALANLLNKDASPYLETAEENYKPLMRAVIDENICIGCTLCIQACPVDAILGASKSMHTVIESECSGCNLCVAPCPMDCIELVPVPGNPPLKSDQWRHRFENRTQRLAQLNCETKPVDKTKERQEYVAAAILRAKSKK